MEGAAINIGGQKDDSKLQKVNRCGPAEPN